MGVYKKVKTITLANQLLNMRRTFNKSVLIKSYIKNNVMICILRLKPSEQSDTYTVKIIYKISKKTPYVWLLSPKLKKFNEKYPHHLYDIDKKSQQAQLCVCAPGTLEWRPSLFISNTFVPWICTWLNAYEFWLITGVWHYDEYSSEKI